jgi:hypothetical protein
MSEPSSRAPAPLVGHVGCRVLGTTFALFALFELAMAQIVEQPSALGQIARVVPIVAFVSAAVAIVERRRLRRVYRGLWLSAACLVAWFAVTWLATLGA